MKKMSTYIYMYSNFDDTRFSETGATEFNSDDYDELDKILTQNLMQPPESVVQGLLKFAKSLTLKDK